jgi:hypothetical protein
MSRIASGDGDLKPENEFENFHRTAMETRDKIQEADEAAMTVVNTTNVGKNQDKLVNLE